MKVLKKGSSCQRGTVGEPRRGFVLPGTSRDKGSRVLETDRLSLWEFCEGKLEGSILY